MDDNAVRKLKYNEIKEVLSLGTSITFTNHQRIGKFGKFADIYSVNVNNNHHCVIKIIPTSRDAKIDDWKPYRIKNEIDIANRITNLVINRNFQNFPILYDNFITTVSNYSNKNLRDAPKNATIMLMEPSNGSLKSWMLRKRCTAEWESCIVQNLLGLVMIEEYLNIIHGDFHYGNSFYDSVESGGVWHYRIHTAHNVYDFYPPNMGQLWKIADFGQSISCYNRSKIIHRKMYGDCTCFFFNVIHITQEEIERGIFPCTLSDDLIEEYHKSMVFTTSPYVPAFVILKRLGWFTYPLDRIINEGNPITINLTRGV